jgi:hypothetical protein
MEKKLDEKYKSMASRRSKSRTKANRTKSIAVSIEQDEKVPFYGYYIRSKNKTEQRQHLAEQALSWIHVQKMRGVHGGLMFDIDDTLIDGNDTVQNGFQFMKTLYEETSLIYPIHIVTARPDDNHGLVMQMLQKKGFFIPPDRLHMLPAQLYGKDYKYVEEFKWKCFSKIATLYGSVIARFGDKLWDVAHVDSLHSYLSHINDKDCYVFFDPKLRGTFSGKLPGT